MKKANNKILLALLGGLIIVFVSLRVFRTPGLERSLPVQLTEIDTAAVTSIHIYSPRYPDDKIQLVRSEKKWELKNGDWTGRLGQGFAQTALMSMMKMVPQRLISRKPDKWRDYGVIDSLGTKVKVLKGEEVLVEVIIGKTGFVQNPEGGFGGTYTNVRVVGQNEVYAVEGPLDSQFSRRFSEWRDKRFVRVNRDSVDRISFQYSDSSFVMNRTNGKWMVGEELADSMAIRGYLIGMSYKNIDHFSDTKPVGQSQATVTFFNRNETLAKFEGWKNESKWILQSQIQPETYFTADATVIKDILMSKKKFLPMVKKK